MIALHQPEEPVAFVRFSLLTATEDEGYLSLNITLQDVIVDCLQQGLGSPVPSRGKPAKLIDLTHPLSTISFRERVR